MINRNFIFFKFSKKTISGRVKVFNIFILGICSKINIILKGSKIGDNSIIASQGKVSNKAYPTNSLLAGIPAKVVKTDITW